MYLIIKLFDGLQLITTAGTFWMYSVFCAFAAVFVVTIVPETKNRDLDSIATLFVKKGNASQPVIVASNKTNRHPTNANESL